MEAHRLGSKMAELIPQKDLSEKADFEAKWIMEKFSNKYILRRYELLKTLCCILILTLAFAIRSAIITL